MNNLTLIKAAPKVRRSKRSKKQKNYPPNQQVPGDTYGRKAGKTVYPVFVGDESNLYKTRKSSDRAPIILALKMKH